MYILEILGIEITQLDRKSRRIVIICFSPKFASTMLVWESYYPQGRQVTSISYFVQCTLFLHIIRVILYHNGTFRQELVPYYIS